VKGTSWRSVCLLGERAKSVPATAARLRAPIRAVIQSGPQVPHTIRRSPLQAFAKWWNRHALNRHPAGKGAAGAEPVGCSDRVNPPRTDKVHAVACSEGEVGPSPRVAAAPWLGESIGLPATPARNELGADLQAHSRMVVLPKAQDAPKLAFVDGLVRDPQAIGANPLDRLHLTIPEEDE
jgi:hypothetical protein